MLRFTSTTTLKFVALAALSTLSACTSLEGTAPRVEKWEWMPEDASADGTYAYDDANDDARANADADADARARAAEDKKEETRSTRSGNWPTQSSNNTLNCTSMAFPTGDARSSAIGIEKCVPREVRLNQPFDYDIIVTNLTGNTLDDVVVTDTVNNTYKYAKSTPAGQSGAAGSMTWALGDMKPHETKVIKVSGAATTEGAIAGCSSFSYSSALCSNIPVVSPQLKLVKTGPAEALKCEEITYNFEVSNTGTGSINNVRISDPLPAGLAMVDGKKTVDFNVGTLTAGQTRQFSAKVIADKSGKFENQATAAADGASTESDVVATTVRQPVLVITQDCPEKSFIGRGLEYSITVTNKGDGPARDTIIEQTLPANTQFSSASDGGKMVGGKATWNLGTLAPNATKTITTALSASAAGKYATSVTAKAYCAAPVSANCSSEITGIPAILLEVVDIEDPVRIGENETYVITVTNQGSAVDTNIVVTVNLEANQQYVSSTGTTNGTASGQTVTFAPVASLAPKEKASFRVVVKNVKPGDVRFKVSMDSDQLTRSVDETEATNVYE